MKTHTMIFGSVWLAALGMLSLPRANAEPASKAPLSFQTLGKDQEIIFSVYTNDPPASFGVSISTKPRAQARIVLAINSSMRLGEAEKIWGHPAGEPVVRLLTPSDLNTLEKFLVTYQARGMLSPPALSGKPAISFERITYRINQEGNRYADVDRKDFYPESLNDQRTFIRDFIGVNPASNK